MNAHELTFPNKSHFRLSILQFENSGKDPALFTSGFCGSEAGSVRTLVKNEQKWTTISDGTRESTQQRCRESLAGGVPVECCSAGISYEHHGTKSTRETNLPLNDL